MALTTVRHVNASFKGYEERADLVADAIASTIKDEAEQLAKASYKVMPKSIRITAESGILTITMRAERA